MPWNRALMNRQSIDLEFRSYHSDVDLEAAYYEHQCKRWLRRCLHRTGETTKVEGPTAFIASRTFLQHL
jgi:hypothetical protein